MRPRHRSLFVCIAVLSGMLSLLFPFQDALARQWHVATNGTENPNGSIAQPWSWIFAMGRADGRVQAGDTVYFHGGVYGDALTNFGNGPQGYFIELLGTPARPCVVMPWNRERVVFRISSAPAPAVLTIYGTHTVVRDFEVECTAPASTVMDGIRIAGPDHGVPDGGRGTRIVNCIVSNATNNGIADQDAEGTELYGNIVYYSGRRTSGGNAYAVYGQNHYATRKLYEHNVFLSTFAEYVLHLYGTNAAVDNMTLRENVIVNTVASARMMFSSALHDCEGIVVERNFWWGRSAGEVILQERKGMVAPVYRNNVFARGRLSFRESTVGRTFEGNVVWGSQPELTSNVNPTVSFDTLQHPNNDWLIGQSSVDLNRVLVLPNRYEPGRALVVVYNSSGLGTVAVDLSGIVGQGAQYEIRDAQNIAGAPVATGTYGGGTVDVGLTSTAVPSPLTQHPEFPAPGHTAREFAVFVVRSSGGEPPPDPEEPGNGSPDEYSLEQNYPNPFNPSTRISFSIPNPGPVALIVYDLLGREVARPANGLLSSGSHTVVFGAEGLAAGIYLYRLSAGGFVETRKMVLVR